MLLENFRPQSKLVTKTTLVNKPKFPVIDAHNHLREPFGGGWDKKPLPELIDLLDKAGVTHYVDLDGGWGEDILYAHLKHFNKFWTWQTASSSWIFASLTCPEPGSISPCPRIV